MINIIWCGLIIVSIIFALITGNAESLTTALFDGVEKVIELFLMMLGFMSFWNGMLSVASSCGAVGMISKLLNPIIRLLFPKLKKETAATDAICMNITANLLGLGNAATPFGIKAMKELALLNTDPHKASREMITFVVINTASIQLIPTGVAALRSEFGSKDPFSILPCVILTSVAALVVGVFITKISGWKERK